MKPHEKAPRRRGFFMAVDEARAQPQETCFTT
jgi:hypothetical protein